MLFVLLTQRLTFAEIEAGRLAFPTSPCKKIIFLLGMPQQGCRQKVSKQLT